VRGDNVNQGMKNLNENEITSLIVDEQAIKIYKDIVMVAEWVQNICDDFADMYSTSVMKPRDIIEFRNAVYSALADSEKELLINNIKDLDLTLAFIYQVHDEAIDRVQPKYYAKTMNQTMNYLEAHSDEMRKYGFYKNGRGIRIVDEQ
jgi:hypothetical protein